MEDDPTTCLTSGRGSGKGVNVVPLLTERHRKYLYTYQKGRILLRVLMYSLKLISGLNRVPNHVHNCRKGRKGGRIQTVITDKIFVSGKSIENFPNVRVNDP